MNTNDIDPATSLPLVGDEFCDDHVSSMDGKKVYLASEARVTWNNPNGATYLGARDLLVQKMIPGDFNGDGYVDFVNDVQAVGAATKPAGLTGDDTYDFNGDGDSTFADTTYLITALMDRLVGDVAQDAVATDIDNADIGKVIGSTGVGTLYIDGDYDFDGDVDGDDLTAAADAFSGAVSPAGYGTGTAGATLIYRAEDGKVWIKADEADGGAITSFQLENNEGTFATDNDTGPTGGTFGDPYKEATENVIADTDLTLAGFSGLPSLGTILPSGMDQAGLLAGPKLFVRVVQDDGTIFSENFEESDGGFTPTGTPNDWAWGSPNSDNSFGLVVTTGNGESAKCWGTNLGEGASPSGLIDTNADSILRSPDINLTSAVGADLGFAAAVDAAAGDTLEVIVRESGTDAVLETLQPITPASEGWSDYGPVDLGSGAGKNVYLEFRFKGNDGTYIGLYIDDVTVRQTLTP